MNALNTALYANVCRPATDCTELHAAVCEFEMPGVQECARDEEEEGAPPPMDQEGEGAVDEDAVSSWKGLCFANGRLRLRSRVTCYGGWQGARCDSPETLTLHLQTPGGADLFAVRPKGIGGRPPAVPLLAFVPGDALGGTLRVYTLQTQLLAAYKLIFSGKSKSRVTCKWQL